MKKFYRCPKCGIEFCLKGGKYCKETDNMLCSGHPASMSSHEEIQMDYAGNTIEQLRILRKKHNNRRAEGRK